MSLCVSILCILSLIYFFLTGTYLTLSVLTSACCGLDIVSPFDLYFNLPLILQVYILVYDARIYIDRYLHMLICRYRYIDVDIGIEIDTVTDIEIAIAIDRVE